MPYLRFQYSVPNFSLDALSMNAGVYLVFIREAMRLAEADCSYQELLLEQLHSMLQEKTREADDLSKTLAKSVCLPRCILKPRQYAQIRRHKG